jgi:PAS domain S-box-containing protein
MGTDQKNQDFFAGGGEMGALMRGYEWAKSPIGEPNSWPQSLRTAIRILLTTQHPMFIWWGPELTQFYNDAYRKTMGPERHPSALGQRGKDCWEEIWEIIGPQIEMVMRGEGATWHEDQLVPVTRHGSREDVWWTYSFSPIDEETADNGVGGVLVVCNDVTDRHRAFEQLARNEERLELALSAGVVGVWDWHIGEGLLFTDRYFAELYGVDNEAAERGLPLEEFSHAIHPGDQERIREQIRKVLSNARDFEEEYRLVRTSGETVWVIARGRCFHDEAGKATRFLGTVIDITDRKRAEEQSKLLTDEMTHRVKNILATVQAITNQTMQDHMQMSDAREALFGRLRTLARAQDILTGKSALGAHLPTVVATAVESYNTNGERVRISGPDIEVNSKAAFSLTLALHELATNAAKYGALSVKSGRVDISWEVERARQACPRFNLTWKERGGPTVSKPKTKGFGSRLIESVISAEFGAKATTDFRPDGVSWLVSGPLENIAAAHETAESN